MFGFVRLTVELRRFILNSEALLFYCNGYRHGPYTEFRFCHVKISNRLYQNGGYHGNCKD